MNEIEEIKHNGAILAIILPHDYQKDGTHFFTPTDFSQQLAYMKHPKGKIIQPHLHNPVQRQVQFTKEVLFVKSGRLRVDFYDNDRNYLESRMLKTGDVILLSEGGHGFEAMEGLELIEVKQGPYAAEMDKIRFEGIKSCDAVIKKG